MAGVFEIAEEKDAHNDLTAFIDSLGKLGFLENYKPTSVTEIPAAVCFGITSKCNLNCRHCLNRNLPSAGTDMTTEQLFDVIDQMGKGGTKSVSLFGGEPLCHPDFKRIVEHLNRYPISLSLNTNGTRIDAETARWLMGHRITGAVVSFDGSRPEIMDRMRGAGSFDGCVKGVKALRAEGMSALLSVTVTRLNYKDISQMASVGRKIGGTSIRFNHTFFAGNAACFLQELYLSPDEEREAIDTVWRLNEEYDTFIYPDSSYLCQKRKLERMKDHKPAHDKMIIPPCGAAGSKCAIRPDGWVTPCEIMWDVKCGNLKEMALSEIWRDSQTMNSFRKPMEIDLNSIPECKGCDYQYICFIGHRCYPYYNPGGIANRDIYCWVKDKK